MNALIETGPVALLDLVARASVVLAAGAILGWTLRRRAAAERHSMWTATFVVLLVLPVAGFVLPAWELPLLPADTAATGRGVIADREESAGPATALEGRAHAARRGTGGAGDASRATARGSDAAPTSAGDRLRVVAGPADLPADGTADRLAARAGLEPTATRALSPVVGLWAAGAVAALISLVVGRIRFGRLVRRGSPVEDPVWLGQVRDLSDELGVRRDVRLLVSAEAPTPMTGGLGTPVILLPASAIAWTPERRRVVLAHELIHVRRRDALRQLVGFLALALYWFHPLSWVAARHAAVCREEACDDAVIELGTRPSEYAGHLLDLSRGPRPAPVLLSLPMIQPSQLERRIMSILEPHRPRRSALASVLALLSVAGLGVSAAIAEPVQTVPEAPATTGARAAATIALPEAAATTEAPLETDAATGRLADADATTGARAAATIALPEGAATTEAPLETASWIAPGADRDPTFASTAQDATCEVDGLRGNFSGTLSYGASRTELSGFHNGDRVIQKFIDEDLRLCLRLHGEVVMSDDGRSVRAVGADSWVVLESEDDDLHRLVIDEGPGGLRYEWTVNGRDADFDADARAWRDRMFTVLDGLWEASRLRGRQSSLRGRISSSRGHVSSLRGRISSARGRVSSLNGRISSARGRVSSMRGRISSLRGRQSSLRSALRASSDPQTKAGLERELRDYDEQIAQVEREIEDYDVEARVAEVEAELAGFDVEARVAELEREIEDYDLDERIAQIEREIVELDADRRAEAIERGLDGDLDELRRLIRRM